MSPEPSLPRLPTRKTRLRRCGTGPANPCGDPSGTRAYWLSRTLHARPYPHSSSSRSRHPKSSPFWPLGPLDRAPGTFSHSTYRGPPPPDASTSSRIARQNCHMSPLAPSSPVRLPAIEKLWQGLPPTRTSTVPNLSWKSPQSILLTSPRLGTFGNRHARTAAGNSSISAKASGSQPSLDHATDAASTPLNKLTYLIRSSP